MKNKDLQTAVKTKHEKGDSSTKISHDLGRVVSLATIKSWIQKLKKIGSINLLHLSCPSTHSSIKSQYLEG